MQRTVTKVYAHQLLTEFGANAYEKAKEAERVARRKRNQRLAKFLGKVARRIELDGCEQSGLDGTSEKA